MKDGSYRANPFLDISISILILIISITNVLAQPRGNATDLTSQFTYYDETSKRFQPFDKSVNSHKARIQVVNQLGGGNRLSLNLPADASLHLNNRMIGTRPVWDFNLDSLESRIGSNSFDFIVVTNSRISLSELRASLNGDNDTTTEDSGQFERQNQTDHNTFINFLVTASIVLFYGFGFLFKKFPKDTVDYLAVYRSFELKNREEALTGSRPFTRTNILFISLSSFLISLALICLATLTNGRVFTLLFDPQYSFWPLVANWTLTAVFIFLLTIAKYMLVSALSGVFNINEFRTSQFFNSYRIVIMSFAVSLLLILVYFMSMRTFEVPFYTLIINALIVILGLRILFIFFKLRDFSSHRNFHLISYLCATEIIPFLALYKVVLG